MDGQIERLLEKMDGAYASNTVKAYRADWVRFKRWCESRNLRPFPASPKALATYVDHLSQTNAIGTIRRAATVIRRLHQLSAVADPTLSLDVQFAIRRAARQTFERPKQALGLTIDLRDALIATCASDLRGLRDRALLAVGFEALSRGSELAALNVDDLTNSKAEGGALLISRGKTDHTGYGRIVVLSRSTTSKLQAWLEAADIGRGPLFRPIYQNTVVSRRLHVRSISQILKERARLAGMSVDQVASISSHSLRIGGAQQLTMDGHQLPQVMRAGGWRSVTTVSRYIELAEISLWE
jgi:site-specific recombinase XerD